MWAFQDPKWQQQSIPGGLGVSFCSWSMESCGVGSGSRIYWCWFIVCYVVKIHSLYCFLILFWLVALIHFVYRFLFMLSGPGRECLPPKRPGKDGRGFEKWGDAAVQSLREQMRVEIHMLCLISVLLSMSCLVCFCLLFMLFVIILCCRDTHVVVTYGQSAWSTG